MRSQFLLLAELQHQDDRLQSLAIDQQHMPQRLQAYKDVCAEAEQKLAHLQDSIERTDQKRRALERELDRSQEQLAKTQNKLHEVKTNKEYSAVLAEIETGKERIATLEDQVLDLMEVTEQHRHACNIQKQHVQETKERLAAQGEQLKTDQESLAQEVDAERAKRQQIVTALEEKLYGVYQKLASQRGGQTVVQVRDGTCGGCHLKVQPQVVSEIRQQDKLITCPHCRRILLWPSE